MVTDSENERSELIEFDEDQVSIMEMIRRYHALPWVEYAEPQYIILPLETRAGDFYANGSYGYHLDIIKAPLAWDIKHDTSQIVAVIDTGLWYRAGASGQPVGHPDIRGTDASRPWGNISADLANTNLVYSNTPNDPWDDTGFWRQTNPYPPMAVYIAAAMELM